MRSLRCEREGGSEVGVNVVERDFSSKHQHLQVIEQLADFLGGAHPALILGSYPHLGGLFDDLLANGMDPGVQLDDGARPLRARSSLAGQLGKQLVKGLHEDQVYGASALLPVTTHGTNRRSRHSQSRSTDLPLLIGIITCQM